MKDNIGAQITICLELSLIVHAFMFIVSMTFGRHLQDICLPIAVLCQCVYTTSKRIEEDNSLELKSRMLFVNLLALIWAIRMLVHLTFRRFSMRQGEDRRWQMLNRYLQN